MEFDSRRQASLDGVWEFFPGDHDLRTLDELEAVPIRVPGLWEAQGFVDLDGVAWYRRRFELDDAAGHWTLRFGAVMDLAEVHLNGVALGAHDQPYTPFELDPTQALRTGVNELAVRVVDPPLTDPDHTRMAHGKQGWANQVFPSRPSLYMTYGGIWQPVTLRRHGPVVVGDVFVNGDPDDLVVTARVQNRTDDPTPSGSRSGRSAWRGRWRRSSPAVGRRPSSCGWAGPPRPGGPPSSRTSTTPWSTSTPPAARATGVRSASACGRYGWTASACSSTACRTG